ncbi:FecR family protein [Yersinia kristensenii]|uniref:FecR family protein n=1 Tax=Yersinia kristensenii TaxID=28152 RepID=UPI0005E8F809|nr:FecR domain-containing protein [Yersinia kristensenii]CNE75788.1 putative two-component system sensor protein [Yersinia kristensenii]
MNNINDRYLVADEQALHWLTKQQNRLSAREQRQFEEWLLQGENAARYQQMEQLWQTVGQLPKENIAQLRSSLPSKASPATQPFFRRWSPFSAAPRLLGPLLLGLILLVLIWPASQWLAPPSMTALVQTARGETKQLTLPDGTLLTLDADTQLQVAYYPQRREVTMSKGQAYFQVRHLADQPFIVLSGPSRLTVLGTEFGVRYIPHSMSGNGVAVEVSSGAVRVGQRTWWENTFWRAMAKLRFATEDSHILVLRASQRAISDVNGKLTRQPSTTHGVSADWRQSRVVFDSTPLDLALAEFARYGEMPYRLGDSKVAAMRISGSFDVHRIDSFVHVLPKVLPVKLTTQSGKTQIQAR